MTTDKIERVPDMPRKADLGELAPPEPTPTDAPAVEAAAGTQAPPTQTVDEILQGIRATMRTDANVAPSTPPVGADIRPGEEHPAMRDATRKRSAPDNVDRRTLGRDRTDPEVQHLPGNTGWTRQLGDAMRKRGDQIALWATTMGDRMNASSETVAAATARARESTMTKRANEFSRREAIHSRELASLGARTGIWNWPGIRSITATQVAYHSWRERVNQRKAARADQRAGRAADQAGTAEKYKGYFDTKVSNRVETVRSKWQEKLNTARKPREQIDVEIAQIADLVAKNKALLIKIRDHATVLENTTGGDHAKRRDQLRNIYKSLTNEEAALEEKQRTLARKQKHRIRLAVAEDTADETLREFATRYRDHQPSTPAEDTFRSNPREEESSPRNELTWSLRELAESKGNITNQQVGKMWNSLFPNEKLNDGYKTLTGFLLLEFPNKNFQDTPEANMSVKNLLENLAELFRENEGFQALVERATNKRGGKAIENLIDRMETHLAFADTMDDL
ncbi:MAG: hypothetical protein WA021_04145 [Minisyncoccia bacterium]